MLDPGQLNRRIQIQQRSTTPGPLGEPSATWTTIYSCWANIQEVKAQLLYETSEFVSKVTRKVTIRWASSVLITPDMRVVFTSGPSTKYLNIESLYDPSEAHEEICLMCYELDGAQ